MQQHSRRTSEIVELRRARAIRGEGHDHLVPAIAERPSVVIADSNRLFAESLAALLQASGIEVRGIAPSAEVALALAGRWRPQLLLVGGLSSDAAAIELGKVVRERYPDVPVLVILEGHDDDAAVAALRCGFAGAVTKSLPSAALLQAVERASRGDQVFTALPSRRTASSDNEPLQRLTARESQVLELLAQGADSDLIAKRLGIRTNTVRTHVQNILTKLGVNSRLEAASLFIRRGGAAWPGAVPGQAAR